MREPRTRAQAIAAAEAVNEARLELLRADGGEKQDRALYHLEMLYWRKADELADELSRRRKARATVANLDRSTPATTEQKAAAGKGAVE